MSEQAAKLSGSCEGCGDLCTGWAVQLTKGGRLRWEIEWACDTCGISHHGAWGQAPIEVRSEILAQHGPYCLKLADGDYRGGSVLKAFRGAFDLSIREAQDSAQKLKECGYEGTYVELHLLADLLKDGGVRAEVLPGGCGES